MNGFLFKNKPILIGISSIIFLIGVAFSYINYGEEPQETIGGFICDLSLGAIIVFVSIKKSE